MRPVTGISGSRGSVGAMVGIIVAVTLGTLSIVGCSRVVAPGPQTEPIGASGASFVIDQDFADPDVMQVDDKYYAYATNRPGANVQVATSSNLEAWRVADTDAFPDLPVWADTGKTWAPEVTQLPDGAFALYFTAADRASGHQCVGVATSVSPVGPFVSSETAPLICPPEDGAIDASSFVDVDGSRYLLWKNDGNCCGRDTWLKSSRLTSDGLRVAGEPIDLVKQTEAWEGKLVEAPVLVVRNDRYILLYSANDYGGTDYAMGYASAESPTGPYTKSLEPLYSTELSGGSLSGPGGGDIVIGPDGEDRLIFHSWEPGFAYRGMNVLPLRWKGGAPIVVGP